MNKIFLKKRNYKTFFNSEKKDKLSIKIEDLEFSVRAMNSLSNQGIETLGELVVHTEHNLRSFPNMGKTSIEEIKNILDDFSLYLGMDLDLVNTEQTNNFAEHKNEEFEEVSKKLLLELIKDFNEIPLSIRAKNALLNLDCNYVGDIISIKKSELFRIRALGYKSIQEIEDYLISLNLNFGDELVPWGKDIIIKLRKELRYEKLQTKKFELISQDKLLEVELKRILKEALQISKKNSSHKDKVIDVLNSRFGLDGSPAKTLEIIGQKYNVTRERIRQNESYGLRKLKFLKPITPILEKIFEILDKLLPITEIEFNKILKEKGLTNIEWDLKGIQDFYESFSSKQDFYISKLNNIRIISKASLENIFKKVLVNINKKISNSGLCSLSECLNFKEVYLNNIKKETIKRILQTKPMFAWLDEQEEWFTFYSRRNRLSNLIAKAATISSNVDIESLYDKIKNYHRLDNVKYSKNIFISFCKNSFDCIVKNNEILFNSSKSKISDYDGYQGNIIAPNEQKIISIFKKYGPILSWWDLNELAKNFDVSEASLNMILQFSVLFKRIDRATYILNGEKLNKKDKKFIKIELTTNTYNKKNCPHVANKDQYYVEVYKSKKYIKTIGYPQTLRIIDKDDMGILYEDKVYPIITDL